MEMAVTQPCKQGRRENVRGPGQFFFRGPLWRHRGIYLGTFKNPQTKLKTLLTA